MDTLIEQIKAAYNRVKTKFPEYNQGQLAELIGVNRSTLSSALNGNEKYGSEKMLRLVDLLFFGREDDSRLPPS